MILVLFSAATISFADNAKKKKGNQIGFRFILNENSFYRICNSLGSKHFPCTRERNQHDCQQGNECHDNLFHSILCMKVSIWFRPNENWNMKPVNPSTHVQVLHGSPVGMFCPLVYSLPFSKQISTSFSSDEWSSEIMCSRYLLLLFF